MSGSDIEENKVKLENLKSTLLSFADANAFFSVLEATLNPNSDAKKVFVGTIHSAKGLEWDSVFLTGMEDGNLPQRQTTDPKVYDEERRIAYVGATRARRFLFFTSIMENEHDKCEPSPFLSEMFGPQEVTQQSVSKPANQTEKHRANVEKTSLSDSEQEEFARDKWKSYQERLIEKSIEEKKACFN